RGPQPDIVIKDAVVLAAPGESVAMHEKESGDRIARQRLRHEDIEAVLRVGPVGKIAMNPNMRERGLWLQRPVNVLGGGGDFRIEAVAERRNMLGDLRRVRAHLRQGCRSKQ